MFSLVALGFISATAFLDTFAIVPVLAPFAKRELSATNAEAGLLVSLYSLTNLLVGFYAGVLLDRFGRRIPMVVSLLLAGGLIALYSVVRTAEAMMVVRALHGVSGAIFVPALFALIGEYGKRNRTLAIGSASALIGLVAALAPPISGLLVREYGERSLFWGIAVLMGLAGLIALTLADPHQRPEREVWISPRAVLRYPLPRASFLLTFGMTFAMGLMVFVLPVMLEEAGYDPAYRGRLLGIFAGIAIAIMLLVRRQGMLGGAFARAWLGVLALGIGALLLPHAPIPTGTYVVVLLYGVGFGLTYPAVHLLVFEGVPLHLRGTALAMLYAFYSLGYVLGPAVSGAVYAYGLAGIVGVGVSGLMLISTLAWGRARMGSGE